MAQTGNNLEDIDPQYLQIESKEDSPSKLAAIVGKLTKYFLFATEFEILRTFVNLLRTDLDALSDARPYVWKALIKQPSPNEFEITEFENSLGAIHINPDTASGTVYFEITSAALFTLDKTYIQISPSITEDTIITHVAKRFTNNIVFVRSDLDALEFTNIYIEIEVKK
jgi:hypothetical protein